MICMGIFLECSLSACKTSQNPGAWLTGVFFVLIVARSGKKWLKVGKSRSSLKKTALQRDCQQQRTKLGAARLARCMTTVRTRKSGKVG